MLLKDSKIAMLGAGNMTEALVSGLLAAGLTTPGLLHATDIRAERRRWLQERYGIRVGAGNAEAASWAQVVILSVEPQVLDGVLEEIRPALAPGTLIISVAAGYSIGRIGGHLPPGMHIVRAMPNTPSSIMAGISAITFGPVVSNAEQALAKAMFEAVGNVIVVEERLMDAVTALSGSGPAYVFLMIEALADGGVKVGLPRSTAETLAAQTVAGAAQMVLTTGEHPGRLKDRVASPGGTTIAGLHKLEEGGLRATLIAAVEASARRSVELGRE